VLHWRQRSSKTDACDYSYYTQSNGRSVAFAPALQLHCRQISCWKLFTAGDILMRVGYCKVYRSCFRTLGAKVLEIFVLMIRHFHRKERKFLERLLPRNESSTGANVPRNESSWNIRSWETKVPWNESSTGAKVLSMVFSLPGTKVQRNEKAWNPTGCRDAIHEYNS